MNNKLTFAEYQQEAARTCLNYSEKNGLLGLKLDLSHMVLGMCSEMNELEDAIEKGDKVNIAEECTDIMWYFANYSRMRNNLYLSFEDTFRQLLEQFKPNSFKILDGEECISTTYYYISKLEDSVKKFMAYDKAIDPGTEQECLCQIAANLVAIYLHHGFDIQEQLYKNIAKLKARFPEKFSTEQAVNRNTTAERAILES